MKKFVLFCASWALCAFSMIGFAQDAKEPFSANIRSLGVYLELLPWQVEEVARINDYFIDQQRESFSHDKSRYAEQMEEALYTNLKLMKGALTKEQYRKYLTLINVTQNNNKYLNNSLSLTDVYLADKNKK